MENLSNDYLDLSSSNDEIEYKEIIHHLIRQYLSNGFFGVALCNHFI